jgi:hypothetical protein
LEPEQWFDVPGRFGVYGAYTDTVVYVRYRNVTQLNFDLYQVSLPEFAYLIGPNSYQRWDQSVPVAGAPIRSWSVPVDNRQHGGFDPHSGEQRRRRRAANGHLFDP